MVALACSGRSAPPERAAAPTLDEQGRAHLEVTLRGAPAGARLRVFRGDRPLLTDPEQREAQARRDAGPLPAIDAEIVHGATGWRVRRQEFAPGSGEVHAYVEPRFTLALTPGPATLVVTRAGETVERRFEVRGSGPVSIALPAATARRCADLHLHGHLEEDAETFGAVLAAEGLSGAALVDWAGRFASGPRSHHWGGFAWGAEEFDVLRSHGSWLQRAQSWGRPERTCSLHLYRHRTPAQGRSKHSIAALAERASGEGAFVSGALGELDVPAALAGAVHASEVLVLGRFHHLERWYDLLSVGAELGAIAGADTQFGAAPQTMVDYHAPPGANRTCLTSRAAPGPDGFFTAARAGRTYVTSGPTLGLAIQDGTRTLGPGQRLTIPRPGVRPVRLQMHAEGPPGGSLELIVGGEVFYERVLPLGDGARVRGVVAVDETVALPLERSTWIALRLSGSEVLPHGERALAHTSPIYVHMGGAPPYDRQAAARLLAAVPEDAEVAESGHTTEEERSAARRLADAARAHLQR